MPIVGTTVGDRQEEVVEDVPDRRQHPAHGVRMDNGKHQLGKHLPRFKKRVVKSVMKKEQDSPSANVQPTAKMETGVDLVEVAVEEDGPEEADHPCNGAFIPMQ